MPRPRLTLLALITSLLTFMPAPSPGHAQPPADTNTAALDAAITAFMRANNLPGVALAVMRDGEVAYTQGYGNAGGGRPVTPDSVFLVGSVSKSFTALAVMQLVEDGLVDLDAPIQTYLPTFTHTDPAHATQITVRHMLTMRSGLSDVGYQEQGTPLSLAARVEDLARARPMANVNTASVYFNENYAALAYLVEVVRGVPFNTVLAERVFAPLGMDDTFGVVLGDEIVAAPNRAAGHVMLFGLPVPRAEARMSVSGDGGIASSANDMAHYLTLFANDGQAPDGTQLISRESIALMHTPPAVDAFYGMGWYPSRLADGTPTVEHSGDMATYHADMVLLPGNRDGFVLLHNLNGYVPGMVAFGTLREQVAAVLLGRTPPAQGTTMRTVGVVSALVVGLSVAYSLVRLARAGRWAAWAQRQNPLVRVLGLLTPLVPAGLLTFLPQIILLVIRRSTPHLYAANFIPDVFLWLVISAGLGVLTFLARMVGLFRRGVGA